MLKYIWATTSYVKNYNIKEYYFLWEEVARRRWKRSLNNLLLLKILKITLVDLTLLITRTSQLWPFSYDGNSLSLAFGVEIVWDNQRMNGSWDAYLVSPADFAGADDIITNLANEKEPGIEIIESTP